MTGILVHQNFLDQGILRALECPICSFKRLRKRIFAQVISVGVLVGGDQVWAQLAGIHRIFCATLQQAKRQSNLQTAFQILQRKFTDEDISPEFLSSKGIYQAEFIFRYVC